MDEQIIVIISAVSAIVVAVGGLTVKLMDALKKVKDLRKILKSKICVIGIWHCPVPDVLAKYPDGTDYNQLIDTSSTQVCVLHLRNLSYGLRKCDWVVANASDDPKLINVSDSQKIETILKGYT